MIVTLLLVAQAMAVDSLPRVTLAEALRRGTDLDPNYVTSLRQVAEAEWARSTAFTALILPSVTAQTSLQRFSTEFFNIGTGQLATEIVSAQLAASYDVPLPNTTKLFEVARRRAELTGAEATEVQQRYATALVIEGDYYAVLAQQELVRVAEERVRRAEEQLSVARARVLTGAAVRTDSLQLLLELTRAEVDRLRQQSSLRVARLQLGRRIGAPGAVDAVPLAVGADRPLPLTERQAVDEAFDRAPSLLAARASVRAAGAGVRSAWSQFLPQLTLTAQLTAFDDQFFPSATTRSILGVTLSLPIWNNGQRELQLSRARSAAAVAEAFESDAERAIRRDVIEAYDAYETARASQGLTQTAVLVASENLRVQDERYRAGATTIIDLVTAQVALAEAEAENVQARYATRLALAGLEAILGRRLFGPGGERE